MAEGLTKIVPILFMLVMGFVLQIRDLVDEKTMHNLKKGVLNIALPAVLFIAFKDMDLRKEYFLVSFIVFLMMNSFLFAGMLINKIFRIDNIVLPFIVTSFAFGLLGIPLYGSVYGIENVGILSVFGIGNEFFAWFIYVTLIKQKLNGEKFSRETVKNFIKSPIILAIIGGILINVLGFQQWIDKVFILKGLELTLSSLALMTTPLILIIVGYGIKLEKIYMKKAFQFLFLRLLVILAIGYLVKLLVFNPLLGEGSQMFNMAYFTYLILPPPFMLALFVSEYSTEENAAVTNNTIVLSTITCVILFTIGVLVVGV